MNFLRQLGWFDPRNKTLPRIHVVGCGGIGSFLVPMLAKMGWNDIHVYDFDLVEEHNMPNQNFSIHDLGMPKVDAMKNRVAMDTGYFLTAVLNAFDPSEVDVSEHGNVYVLAVDSIDTRRDVFEQVLGLDNTLAVFDGRLGGLMYEVFGVDTSDEEQVFEYRSTLFPSSERVELPCTQRSIVYVGSAIAADMCAAIRKWYMNTKSFDEFFEIGRQVG